MVPSKKFHGLHREVQNDKLHWGRLYDANLYGPVLIHVPLKVTAASLQPFPGAVHDGVDEPGLFLLGHAC